jgi:hypothetical protein
MMGRDDMGGFTAGLRAGSALALVAADAFA